MDTAKTFEQALDAFIADAQWLGTEDLPALVSLRAIAKSLDGGDINAAMVAQWGLQYRALLKRSPDSAAAPSDPLAAALADLDG